MTHHLARKLAAQAALITWLFAHPVLAAATMFHSGLAGVVHQTVVIVAATLVCAGYAALIWLARRDAPDMPDHP